MRLISQLIKNISSVLQKVLKYFNDIAISTFFALPAAGVFPVILILNLKLDFQVPENFAKLKIFPVLFEKMSSFV